MEETLAVFEDYDIRRVYDEEAEIWYFSVVDVIRALTQQVDYQAARKYWNKLKQRLGEEGFQSVTICHRLKMKAADGKRYLTDVANCSFCAAVGNKRYS
jgi:DNA-damage-inducible protein D